MLRLRPLPATVLLTLSALTAANPFTVEHTTTYTTIIPLSPSNPHSNHTHIIHERGCANPCGYYGQVCCNAGETCFTDANNEAQCGASDGGAPTTPQAGDAGYWQYYTSTWVETDYITKTSVYSSYIGGGAVQTSTYCPTSPWAGATATAAAAQCNWDAGESSCGNICCPSGQYCQVSGQCTPAAGGSVSAPLRPTMSGSYSVVTQTQFSTTTTEPFISPIATGQSVNITSTQADNGGGLSGGAIAGIVIGVLAAIILLILLALYLCARSLFLAIFGRNNRDRRRSTYIEESYHRSGRGGAARSNKWYGAPRPRRVVEERKTTRRGFGPAMGLGALGGAFGFNRGRNQGSQGRRGGRRRVDEKSEYSSDYSYSDYTASECYLPLNEIECGIS